MAYSSLGRQRGLALLLAILVVVMVSAVAVSILHEEKYVLRKTSHIMQMDRAGLYAAALEDWGRLILRQDAEDSDTDSLDEDWAGGIPGIPIEGGFLTGFFEDEQSRFNLNSLLESEIQVERFRRLCRSLEVDDVFIPALMDWIDDDLDIRYPDGMEENYDTYRVANREMVDISELLLVHNVTPEMYQKLAPYITALPATTTINVNTMSAEVYESLGEEAGDAGQFIEERDEEPFSSIDDFVERLQLPIEIDGLSVSSSFFRARGQVVQGEQVYFLTSLIYRNDNGKTSVLNRSLERF